MLPSLISAASSLIHVCHVLPQLRFSDRFHVSAGDIVLQISSSVTDS